MNLYDVLEVQHSADDETIRDALRRQTIRWRQRVSSASSLEKRHEAEMMQQHLQEARTTLLDPQRRAQYDAALVAAPTVSETESVVGAFPLKAFLPAPKGSRQTNAESKMAWSAATILLVMGVLVAVGLSIQSQSQPSTGSTSRLAGMSDTHNGTAQDANHPSLSSFELGETVEWFRIDALSGSKDHIASIAGRWTQASAVWYAEGSKAAVWLQREAPTDVDASFMASELWTVDLVAKTASRIPLPPAGRLKRVDFDATGRLMAFTLHQVTIDRNGDTTQIPFQGEYLRVPERLAGLGPPALAHAWSMGKSDWSLVETVASVDSAYLAGEAELTSHKKTIGMQEPGFEGSEVNDEPTLQRLRQFAPDKVPEPGIADWCRVTSGGHHVYFWRLLGDFVHFTGKIALEGREGLEAPEGLYWPGGSEPDLDYRGHWFLVTASEPETKLTHVRLYNLQDGRLVFRSDARSMISWWGHNLDTNRAY